MSLGSNPNRFLASSVTGFVAQRSGWGSNGAIRNIWAGEATVVAGASIADTAAYPNGYEPPGSWVMAPKGGGLSAYNQISGEGDVAADLLMGINLEADLTGSGTISAAALTLIVQLAADLTGSGTISSATLQAIAGLSAALSGSGTISASTLSLIVSMIASLTGSGEASGDLKGIANMSADIVVTGGALTAGQVADAVWDELIADHLDAGSTGEKLNSAASAGDPWSTALPGAYAVGTAGHIVGNILSTIPDAVWAEALEAGFDASKLVRIIAAAVAGKSSGGPSSPVFRNVGDTQDQITGVATSDGDRTSATYGS